MSLEQNSLPPEEPIKSGHQTPSFVSEAVLLLLASSIAYYYSFKFEQGYLRQFHFNEQFVQLTTERLLEQQLGFLAFSFLYSKP